MRKKFIALIMALSWSMAVGSSTLFADDIDDYIAQIEAQLTGEWNGTIEYVVHASLPDVEVTLTITEIELRPYEGYYDPLKNLKLSGSVRLTVNGVTKTFNLSYVFVGRAFRREFKDDQWRNVPSPENVSLQIGFQDETKGRILLRLKVPNILTAGAGAAELHDVYFGTLSKKQQN